MKYFIVTTIALLALSQNVVAQESSGRTNADAPDVNTNVLGGFFQSHCVKCHGPRKQNSGVRLDRLDPLISDHASLTQWQDVLDVLNTGEMPPKDQKQPGKVELTAAIGLITDNISSARKRLAAS